MGTDYVFDNKDDLVNYLHLKLSNPTKIKIQKTLYLLFAYYGATYGNLSETKDNGDDEFDNQSYPELLFNAKFEAWRYGPVEVDVYNNEKQGCYEDAQDEEILDLTPESKNIKQFIDSIIKQTNGIDDFSLVDRTHQDKCWMDRYKEGLSHIPMDNAEIIKEYNERYIKK